jgi:hypothetical protein
MIRRGTWRLTVVVTLAGGIACAQGLELQAGLTPAERFTVLRYLHCIDCVIDLDGVRELATRKPGATVDSLNSGLLLGPGVETVAAAESVLVIGYLRDSVWRAQQGLLPMKPRIVYVEQARDRFVNGYRSRGAYGLGWIHTPRAVAHLDSALTLPLPPSVMRAVKFARDSLPPPQ